jgi:hypothetical protein
MGAGELRALVAEYEASAAYGGRPDVPQGVLTAIGKALRNDPRFIRQRDQSRVTQPVWRLSNRA